MLALLIPGLLFTPLAWAVMSVLVDFRRGYWLCWAGILLQALVSVGLWLTVAREGGQYYALGGWPAPLGIELRVDGMAVTFVLFTALVASAAALHAGVYLDAAKGDPRYFWPLFWFLWAGLNGVWLAGDLFNLYVGLELITLAAVGLVALGGEAGALRAALRYLFAALLGSLGYLLAVALLYGGYGTLSLSGLAALAAEQPPPLLVILLAAAGLAFKTALFPLHFWLPPAHGIAKSPVSALLSALVVKASFYVFARLWWGLGEGAAGWWLAQALGALGAGGVLVGGWLALRQARLKMVVAYSSVAQIGYLFLLFPLSQGGETAELARQGVMLHLLSHALAKAAMFLAAGNLILAVGSPRVDALAGVSRFLPFSLFSFGLAAVSLMGLPPSGGFVAKWLLLQASIRSGQWWWILLLVAGGLLSALYLFRIFRASFLEKGGEDTFYHPPRGLEVIPMVLALMAIGLGFAAEWPLAVLALPFAGEGGS